MAEKKKNMKNRNTMANGVVIAVYVESSRTRSSKLSEDPMKKTKQHPHFRMLQAAGTRRCYDRRAQLLAYSRQLRNEGSEKDQVQLPQPRSKKRLWLPQPVRICSRHECAEPKESKEISRSKKRKGSGNNCYPFLKKLKNMLKKLSCKDIK